MLLSQNKEPVKAEMETKTAAYQADKLEFIKNPVVAEFLGLSSNIDFTESELDDYFIDLVFYNYILKCFVLIDLKTSKITHQDVGQFPFTASNFGR
jgi:predicted nuclease of restriction endonuclease-like (RecB) superfamily